MLLAYDIAWASTLNVKPSLGAALVGWHPRKMSLVDGIDLYWWSFKAHRR